MGSTQRLAAEGGKVFEHADLHLGADPRQPPPDQGRRFSMGAAFLLAGYAQGVLGDWPPSFSYHFLTIYTQKTYLS
jgi:hypothetical protein